MVSPSNRLSCTLDWRIISFLVLSFHVTCLQFIALLDAARLLNLKLYFTDNLLASPHIGFLTSLKTNPAPLTFFVLVTHQDLTLKMSSYLSNFPKLLFNFILLLLKFHLPFIERNIIYIVKPRLPVHYDT